MTLPESVVQQPWPVLLDLADKMGAVMELHRAGLIQSDSAAELKKRIIQEAEAEFGDPADATVRSLLCVCGMSVNTYAVFHPDPQLALKEAVRMFKGLPEAMQAKANADQWKAVERDFTVWLDTKPAVGDAATFIPTQGYGFVCVVVPGR